MLRICILAVALFVAACGGGDSVPGDPFGITQRTIVSGLTFPTGLPDPGQLTPVRAFPNIGFDRPLYLSRTAASGCSTTTLRSRRPRSFST